jgi:hypothetical protein
MSAIVLASTLHDPENRLDKLIRTYGPLIKQIFKTSYVIVTPNTSLNTTKTLTRLGFPISQGSTKAIITYKTALHHALTTKPDRIFYCDFDRLLHWARTYPAELKTIPSAHLDHDFLLVARTARAFHTHPPTQTLTEDLANQLASRASGFTSTMDIISACWRFTPRLVEELLQLPVDNTYGFYCEWPIVAWKYAQHPDYLEVEGLEWETPDRYAQEIAATGYAQWLHAFQTPDEWARRVELLTDLIHSISKYLRPSEP